MRRCAIQPRIVDHRDWRGRRRAAPAAAGRRREDDTIVEASIASDRTELPAARPDAALDRETALREAAQRRAERLAQDHEDAYERLLMRCRALEAEALLWSEEKARFLVRQGAAGDRTAELEASLAELEASLAACEARLARAAALGEERERADRDRMERQIQAIAAAHEADLSRLAAEHDAALSAAEDRLHDARHDLLEAEKAFRVEAFRLSALVALKAQEADDRAGEAAGLQDQLRAVLASSSWRLSRPLRSIGSLLARVRP